MRKLKCTAIAAGVMFMFYVQTAEAGSVDMEALQQKMDQIVYQNKMLTQKMAVMQEEIQALKAAEAQQEAAIEAATAIAEEASEGLVSSINENISLSGAIEVEMGWAEDFDGGEESDIALATAEIAIEAQVTEWGIGVMVLEWDDEDDKITVDEAFINIGNTEKYPIYTQIGRYVTPFGLYDGNTISDPLTKEVFKTKEDALLVGAEVNGINGNFFIFNGDTNEGGGDDNIGHWGVNLSYSEENDTVAFNAGIGYLSSVFDSGGLTGAAEDLKSDADAVGSGITYVDDSSFLNADDVGGAAINAGLRIADFVFVAEYITALEDHETIYTSGGGFTAQPVAYHIEAGYNFNIGDHASLVSLAYSGTDDLGGLFPESRIAVNLGVELFDGVNLGLEYTHDEDYDVAEGGTGENANSVLTQLAYEF